MDKQRVKLMMESLGMDVNVIVADGISISDKMGSIVTSIIQIEGILQELVDEALK